MTKPEDNPVTVARELTGALENVEARLREAIDKRVGEAAEDSRKRDDQLKQYGRRNRQLAGLALVSVVLDIATTLGVVIALVGVHNNSATVQDVHAANVTSCKYNNIRLARQEKSIDKILTPAGPGARSPRVERYLARDRAEIAIAWKPRDCAKVYSLKG